MQVRNLKVLFPKKKEVSYIQKGISFKSFVGHSRHSQSGLSFSFHILSQPYFPTIHIHLPYPKYLSAFPIFSLCLEYMHITKSSLSFKPKLNKFPLSHSLLLRTFATSLSQHMESIIVGFIFISLLSALCKLP